VNSPPRIEQLDATGVIGARSDLADILIDCVEGGASVSFMAPLDRETAERFWEGVRARVELGTTHLFVARAPNNEIVGTVQLILITASNQPHRAEIAKLLVHRRARRMGVAQALMAAAEAGAKTRGRTLLTLDTITGTDAARLYERLGWNLAGVIPGFALMPDGTPGDTSIYWKRI